LKGVFIDFMSFAPSFGMAFIGERGQQISQEFVLLRMFRIARLIMVVMNNWPECELALDALYLSTLKSLPTLSALLLMMGVALALGSSLLYALELPGYNGRKSPLDSIPMAAWSVLEMVSTVGLGDVAPITPLGRLLGGFLMTGAMALVAFPSIIIASNFQKVYERLQRERDAVEQHTVANLVEEQMERV
jgi:voltage-gated potassium channel